MVKDPTSNEQDAITWHWNFLKKFESFEKELRAKLQECNTVFEDTETDLIQLIKEILGE